MQALDVATDGMAEAEYWPSMSDKFPYARSRRCYSERKLRDTADWLRMR